MRNVRLFLEGPKDVYFVHEFLIRSFPVRFDRVANPIAETMKYTAAFDKRTWDDNGINRCFDSEELWDWTGERLTPLKSFVEGLFDRKNVGLQRFV